MSNILAKNEAEVLFDKFSYHIIKPAITKHQKEVALGLAKILWLSLVTGKDSEQNIYTTLSGVLKNNHDSNVAIGSLYFYKMKTSLTDSEIKQLKEFYAIDENLNSLQDWIK
jgi:hypothetical protein